MCTCSTANLRGDGFMCNICPILFDLNKHLIAFSFIQKCYYSMLNSVPISDKTEGSSK